MLGIFHEILSSVGIFQHYTFSKYSVRNKSIIVSNSLDPDLGPKCLQRSSADDKLAASRQRVVEMMLVYSDCES